MTNEKNLSFNHSPDEAIVRVADIRYFALSKQGITRKKNEDKLGLFPEQGLFLVADGMGGMPAGDIASMLVVDILPELIALRMSDLESLNPGDIIKELRQAIIDLSHRLLLQSKHLAEYAGMGSTLALVYLKDELFFAAHLGDSRIYLLKEQALHQLSSDHTLVHHLLQNELISAKEVVHHPAKNQLFQYIGMQGIPEPDIICLPRMIDDRLLLCSDGLTNILSDQAIRQILLNNPTPEKACHSLLKNVSIAGRKDDTSVLVIG